MLHNLMASRLARKLPDRFPGNVFVCYIQVSSLLPAVEALNILVWVLIRFSLSASGWLFALPLASVLVTLLALALLFALPLVQSTDVHWLPCSSALLS